MSPRLSLPQAYALVVIAAITVLAVSCGNDPTPAPTPTPATTSAPSASSIDPCGIGAKENDFSYREKGRKGAEFAETVLRLGEMRLSEGKELTKLLFDMSKEFHAEQQSEEQRSGVDQRYNYVMDIDECEIYVAVFTDDAETTFGQLSPDICEPGRATPVSKYVRAGMMINSAGEPDNTPCLLSFKFGHQDDQGNHDLGILDAISKHLMLSQRVGNKSLQDFPEDPEMLDKRKVGYAGELLVNLEADAECPYTINAGSGTYKPTEGLLTQVATHFSSILGEVPCTKYLLPPNKGMTFGPGVEPSIAGASNGT